MIDSGPGKANVGKPWMVDAQPGFFLSFFPLAPGRALEAGRFPQTLAVWPGGPAAGLAQVLGEAELKLDHVELEDSASLLGKDSLGKDSGSEATSHRLSSAA